MEKRKAHYDLNKVKEIVAKRGMDAFTRTAKDNARLMGLDGQAALDVVARLQQGMLFKSMTSNADSQVWQDVYHVLPERYHCLRQGDDSGGATVIQFKEK